MSNDFPRPGRRIPVQKRSREKRDALLAAARALIEREGIAALSAVQVAREAGLPVGSVYFYFPDTMDMLDALAADWLASLRAGFRSLAEGPVPEAGWQAWLDALLGITYGQTFDQRRFEQEITRALSFYPALATTQAEHADAVAGILADMLQKAGALWPRERLLQLARYGFEVIGAFDTFAMLPGADARAALGWTRQALTGLVQQVFDQ